MLLIKLFVTPTEVSKLANTMVTHCWGRRLTPQRHTTELRYAYQTITPVIGQLQ